MMQSIFLAIGLFVGGLIVWLLLRGKISVADANGRGAGEVERTSLSEQLKAASQELVSTRARLTNMEVTLQSLQAELDKQNRQCAQLSERADRLVIVEKTLQGASEVAEALKSEVANWREANGRLTSEVEGTQKRLSEVEIANHQLSKDRESLLYDQAEFKAKIAELNITIEQEQRQSEEKLALLTNARDQLSNQFKALANEILDEKSKKFTEQNKTNLGQILDPLKEKITEFQTKVEEVYVKESKDRSALAEQVKMLTQLNNTLSQDAQNLTLALKGDRKAQGNWGEIILEDVLERAGLVRGQHYDVQDSVKSGDGESHVIADVVVHLPGARHIVIDSKLTLPDYRSFASADDEGERTAALKRHLAATRAHMKGLSEKKYQTLYGLTSLDFVVMFVPLEPAFMLAVTNDRELFHDAWDKNVLLVSPSTLLFVIRTVATLWRHEDISRNAQEISRRGAELYDKLVGFVADLQKVGDRIGQAQDSFNEARRKLSQGRGHLLRQAEMLKELGVNPTKSLPAEWVDSVDQEANATLSHDSNAQQSASDKIESQGSNVE